MKFKLTFEMEEWNCDYCRYQERFFAGWSCEHLVGIYNKKEDVMRNCPLELIGDDK